MELDALAQVEGVGLAVLGDLPAMRQVGDDSLAAVARIAPHQIVEHAALAAQAVDRARLVKVEMRWPRGDGVFQHATRFRVGLRRLELKFRAVEFVGHALRQRLPGHAEDGNARRGRPFDKRTSIYTRTRGPWIAHCLSSHLVFSRPSTMCSDGLSIFCGPKLTREISGSLA